MVNYIDTIEERKDKEVMEYVHVISKSETLSKLEPSVFVSTKDPKFKILEVKENKINHPIEPVVLILVFKKG